MSQTPDESRRAVVKHLEQINAALSGMSSTTTAVISQTRGNTKSIESLDARLTALVGRVERLESYFEELEGEEPLPWTTPKGGLN